MDDRLAFALAIAGAGFAAWAFVRYVGTGAGSGVETYAYRPYGSQGGAIPLPPGPNQTPDYRSLARRYAQAARCAAGVVRAVD